MFVYIIQYNIVGTTKVWELPALIYPHDDMLLFLGYSAFRSTQNIFIKLLQNYFKFFLATEFSTACLPDAFNQA